MKKTFSVRTLIFSIVSAVLMLVVVGCSGSSSVEGDKEKSSGGGSKGGTERISIATASTSGAWYPLGGAWANLITENVDGLEATAEVGAASIENVRKLNNGDVGLAFMQPDVAYNAYEGKEDFEGHQMGDIRALLASYGTVTQLITLQDSGINSIADMEGKRIGVGSPGSGNEKTAKKVLEYNNITYDDIEEEFISFPEMINGMKDGQIDVAIGNMPVPTGVVTDLSLQHDIKIIPIEGETREKFLEGNPFFFKKVIPAGSYDDVKEDIETIAFRGVVYGTTNLTDEQAYQIVSTIWENRDKWTNVHAVTKDINLETAIEGIPTPLHPGAVKYYKEKGIEIPEALIPPEMK